MWREPKEEEKSAIIRLIEKTDFKKWQFISDVFGIIFMFPVVLAVTQVKTIGIVPVIAAGIFWILIKVAVGKIGKAATRNAMIPLQSGQIYISDNVPVTKCYRNSSSIIVHAGNYSTKSRVGRLKEGENCRFVHIGEKNLYEATNTSSRFAITDEVLNKYI